MSTWSGVYWLAVDRASLEVSDVRAIHQGEGIYFGITYDADAYYVLCRRYEQDRQNQILVFDRDFQLLDRLVPRGRVGEAHQIQKAGDFIYIANTNRNCISRLSVSTSELEDIFPIENKRERNFHHINTLYVSEDTLRISAANRFRNSLVIDYSLSAAKIVDVDGTAAIAHNLVPTPWGDLTCDSFNGALVLWSNGFSPEGTENPLVMIYLLPDTPAATTLVIDQQRINFRGKRGNPVFPRGLAVSSETVFVGISDFGRRDGRQYSQSRLFVMEPLSACLGGGRPTRVATVRLGSHGDVMDVRLINTPDHGHPTPVGGMPAAHS